MRAFYPWNDLFLKPVVVRPARIRRAVSSSLAPSSSRSVHSCSAASGLDSAGLSHHTSHGVCQTSLISGHFAPINARSVEGGVEISCYCAGACEKEFDVQVQGDEIAISGAFARTVHDDQGGPESGNEDSDKVGDNWIVSERPFGNFKRVVKVPFEIDKETVDAVYSQGVLTITVRKVNIQPERKIAIKVQ